MTTLRTAAQQALEALEQSETTVRYEGFGLAHREAERKHQAAITLPRATVEQALEALKEADDLLRIARGAMWKLGLNGLGSDCRLSHEVRMFALEFSAESRDGPGVLQVNGTGRALNALKSIRAAIKAAEEAK